MTTQVMPIESLMKLLVPGRCLYLYGGEELGFPLKPVFIQISGHHLDKREIEVEQKNAQQITDPEKRAAALKLFAEPGQKIFAKVIPEDLVSTSQLEHHLNQLKASKKEFMTFIQRYLQLRKTMEVPESEGVSVTPEELELYKLHQYIIQIPKEVLLKYTKSDKERYDDMKRAGIQLRTRNGDCQNDLELEYLKLHRKVKK